MDKKERTKIIEIDGRKFVLCKFNALTGSYILFKLTKIITPILNTLKNVDELSELKLEDINLTELASSLFTLKEEEFSYIQEHCLKSTNEVLPAGNVAVLNEFGVWGNEGLEFDTALVLNLTLKELVFNIAPFFTGLQSSSIMKDLTLSLQSLKI